MTSAFRVTICRAFDSVHAQLVPDAWAAEAKPKRTATMQNVVASAAARVYRLKPRLTRIWKLFMFPP